MTCSKCGATSKQMTICANDSKKICKICCIESGGHNCEFWKMCFETVK